LFGVPGDYNLQFLDHVIAHETITWVGCANELNAAYAADGYARCAPAGALLTTFGVGELSAMNGVAGSYAESLPVIHIVGSPSTKSQRAGCLMHHTLADGDFGHFAKMWKEVTCSQTDLTSNNTSYLCSEIDRVIADAFYYRRPGYLLLPSDKVEVPVIAAPRAFALSKPPISEESLEAFTVAVREKLQTAKRVSLLAGFLADRFGAKEAVQKLVELPNILHSTLLLGKGVLDETNPNFVGTYSGATSLPEIRSAIEDVDITINVGVRFTDTVTAGFSQHMEASKCIHIDPFQSIVAEEIFAQIPMVTAIKVVTEIAQSLSAQWIAPKVEKVFPESPGLKLDQQQLWAGIQKFIRADDILIADQGTSCFGAAALVLPKNVNFIAQPLWGSIGYTIPAAYGAQTAEPNRRVVLIVGDGAAQLTVQELGSMLRDGQKVIIFLLNNEGYTVERAIHGANARYNDISQWSWTLLPAAMGLGKKAFTSRVTDPKELQRVLGEIGDLDHLALVEVILPKLDIPLLLQLVGKAMEAANTAN